MFINPGLITVFHGCDKSVRDKIVSSEIEHIRHSKADWEWLGAGQYFWENSYEMALDWAHYIKRHPMPNSRNPILEPSVIGAIVDLKNCLDFLDVKHLQLLKTSYNIIKDSPTLPKNSLTNPAVRKLDYYVIENIHRYIESDGLPQFDSVRSVFVEGELTYPTAGFKDKNHIQICIRNSDCIKGYFIPRLEE
jgi:hypothetical protein